MIILRIVGIVGLKFKRIVNYVSQSSSLCLCGCDGMKRAFDFEPHERYKNAKFEMPFFQRSCGLE